MVDIRLTCLPLSMFYRHGRANTMHNIKVRPFALFLLIVAALVRVA
jgi:hypothetical protein